MTGDGGSSTDARYSRETRWLNNVDKHFMKFLSEKDSVEKEWYRWPYMTIDSDLQGVAAYRILRGD